MLKDLNPKDLYIKKEQAYSLELLCLKDLNFYKVKDCFKFLFFYHEGLVCLVYCFKYFYFQVLQMIITILNYII